MLVIERILRDREGLWRQIADEHQINGLIGQMLLSTSISLGLYGIVLGLSNSWLQALSSAIKLPILFLLTLAICLPSLYLFNLVFGSRLTVRQALAIVMAALTVTGMLTLAFAPISLFFLISAPDYSFFKVLNVAILTLAGIVGLSFLVSGMRFMNTVTERPAPALPPAVEPSPKDAPQPVPAAPSAVQPVNMSLLYIWIVLFGFVGTQLGWTLRPFFGDPNQPFALFRNIEGNFYMNLVHSVTSMLS
ncbi:MAG: hypothetical protein HGA45_09275 [Chloroflexales bacterium]|nr:hypothetical protein [Chloroflexales bacterium]